MENKRYFEYKLHKPKYNEGNYLISNYLQSELDNEEKYDSLEDNNSKIKYYYKNPIIKNNRNNNFYKCDNINSPSFGCRKPKSVDDINYKNNNSKKINNTSINSNNSNKIKKIKCYKRPRHYLYNKSVDNIKSKINYRNIDVGYKVNNYNNNYQNNYNKCNSKVLNQNNMKNENDELYGNRFFTRNTIFSKINPNDELINVESSFLGRNNSIDNIFTKIPTNISRIKNNNNDSIGQSSEYSLLNNNTNNINSINNIKNYYSINSENKKYINNNYLYYNNTFYNDKNGENNMINKRIYFKTPVKRNKFLNNRYTRKISEDYCTTYNKKNNVKDLLNKERIRKEYYFSNDTSSTNLGTKRYSNKFNKILTPKINQYKDYLIVYNDKNNFNNKSYNNSNNINMNINNETHDNNLGINDKNRKIFKHKKLSSYILKNKKEKQSNVKDIKDNRKNSAKSYDNSIFKKKIKLVKKKRPKGRRNKTYDENILDKASATPIKKEDDKGGKIDLKDKRFNTLNNSNRKKKLTKKDIIDIENFNHQMNINIKNIKLNLNKIILIQKWWKNILQDKIIKVNNKFNEYKLNKITSKKPKNKINMNSKKTYLNNNKKYYTIQVNNNYNQENESIIKRKNIPKIFYITKKYTKNIYQKIILLQRYIRNKLLNNKNNKIKFYSNEKLGRYRVNNIYFGKNENKYILGNFVYHIQKSNEIKNNKDKNNNEIIYSLPLNKNCFITKINIKYIKKKKIINNDFKIVNETSDVYINNIKKKKKIYEIDNIFNNEILPIYHNNTSYKIKKIEKQAEIKINGENIIKIPKIRNCNISKIICYKNKNIIINHPLNKKHEYISKTNKTNIQLNSLISLQKYITNYLKNKANKNKMHDLDYLTKPTLSNNYISKIIKTNINNDIEKIKNIQKKFREYQQNTININTSNLLINDIIQNKNYNFTRNYTINDCNKNGNDLKSFSSNDNTSQRSKRDQKNYSMHEEKENIIDIINKQKLNEFIQLLIQKISKNINQYIFYKIKNRKNNGGNDENVFFSIIKRIIKIYNNISKSKNNEFNEFNELIKNNLEKNINNLNKNNFISYIPEQEENNLKNIQLFLYNDKLLSKFIVHCLKIENKHINNNINNLIEYRLIKEPLKNQNIFTIIKYMDNLYENILNKNICLNCFCKQREKCGIGCSCHHSTNLKNITTKFNKYLPINRKNKTHTSSLSYSFDEINYNYNLNNANKNNKNDDFEIISNFLLYDKIFKRNIYYSINKVNKLNNSMDDSESSEIDIFQKMNEGSQSLKKKEMINKIFDEYNKERMNKNKNNSSNNIINIFDENNFEGKKIRHVSKLSSSSSDIINLPNCEEEDNTLNKIKNYFEEKK